MAQTLYSKEKAEVDRWALQEGRLAGLINKERRRTERRKEDPFATHQLNDFFASVHPRTPLPWEWKWIYGCPRGHFNAFTRYSAVRVSP